jgi:hypothetical protein
MSAGSKLRRDLKNQTKSKKDREKKAQLVAALDLGKKLSCKGCKTEFQGGVEDFDRFAEDHKNCR